MNLSVTARVIAAVAMVTAVAACGSNDDNKAAAPSKPSVVAMSAAPAPASAPASSAADAPAATSDPSADDLSKIPRTYDKACSDLLSFFQHSQEIDKQNGVQGSSPADDAKQILDAVQKNDEWKTLSDHERSEVTRGIKAAAAGKC